MKRDCYCLGNNETCYRCYGSGYYDDTPLPPMPPAPNTSAGFHSKPGHLGSPMTRTPLKPRTPVACPICGKKKVGLGDHMKAKHAFKRGSVPLGIDVWQGRTNAPVGTSMELATIASGEKDDPRRLEVPVHPPSRVPGARRRGRSEASQPRPTTEARPQSEDNDRARVTGLEPDLHDAKRYWGHSFRDGTSIFGSHPAHDRFDDDSDPK